MLDYRFIKDHLEEVKENIKNRGVHADPDLVVELFDKRNHVIYELESLRKKRNDNSDFIKKHSANAGLSNCEKQKLVDAGRKLKEDIALLETSLEGLENKLKVEGMRIPNMAHPEAPQWCGEQGLEDQGNVEILRSGLIPSFNFKPRDHVELASLLDIVDFDII